MSTCYFLIPGFRVPEEQFGGIASRIDQSALSGILSGFGSPAEQRLAEGLTAPFSLCAHHLWFWSVVTRGKTTPAHAAYVWLEDHGPTLSTEIWDITPCIRTENAPKGLGSDPLTAEEIDACSPVLRPVLARHGFVLQQWDRVWYATRMKDWDAVTAPWSSAPYEAAENLIAGNRESALLAMREAGNALRNSEVSRKRAAEGRPAPDFVWISGGGRQIRFYPPTRVRGVISNESVLRSWAMEAGILCQYVAPLTDKGWPAEVPPGDVIAVIDDLWEPWLKKDWNTWIATIPEVARKVSLLKQLACARKNDSFALVACGNGTTVTLSSRKEGLKGLFGRFAKKSDAGFSWLSEKAH